MPRKAKSDVYTQCAKVPTMVYMSTTRIFFYQTRHRQDSRSPSSGLSYDTHGHRTNHACKSAECSSSFQYNKNRILYTYSLKSELIQSAAIQTASHNCHSDAPLHDRSVNVASVHTHPLYLTPRPAVICRSCSTRSTLLQLLLLDTSRLTSHPQAESTSPKAASANNSALLRNVVRLCRCGVADATGGLIFGLRRVGVAQQRVEPAQQSVGPASNFSSRAGVAGQLCRPSRHGLLET